MSKMVQVAHSLPEAAAEMTRLLLDGDGIEAEVLHGPMPGQLASILVPEEDVETAKELLAGMAEKAEQTQTCAGRS